MEAPMRTEFIDTLIIGGGQAGLAMSHMLSQRGCPNIVVERHRIAERWRTERWDGLRFQFPNWSIQLPDFPFPHTEPNAFATSAEIVRAKLQPRPRPPAPTTLARRCAAPRSGDQQKFLVGRAGKR